MSQIIRCKVICQQTGQRWTGTDTVSKQKYLGYTAKFCGVYDPDPSSINGQFFKYTPQADVTLEVMSADYFEPGTEYYLDFIPVPEG